MSVRCGVLLPFFLFFFKGRKDTRKKKREREKGKKKEKKNPDVPFLSRLWLIFQKRWVGRVRGGYEKINWLTLLQKRKLTGGWE